MSLLKNGWHPAGDKEIHRSTWKKDLKSIASRKDADADRARSHQSTPLSSLKDPDSFGPPPKHSAYHPNAQAGPSRSSAARPSPALPSRSAAVVKEQEQEDPPAPKAYSTNTTGLRTDDLPPPPGRRDVPSVPVAGARPVPALPPRTASGPPPLLPPRQSENPSEYDPPPPPTYGEALQAPAVQAAAINRLGQAGVSVAGFGIGSGQSSQSPQGQASQLGELQQRFARMDTRASTASSTSAPNWRQASTDSAVPELPTWKQAQTAYNAVATAPVSSNAQSVAALAGQKKKPPPPPAKKAEFSGDTPPPVPMSSKPRPG